MPLKQGSRKPREDEVQRDSIRRIERDVDTLNRCLDDIEHFVSKLQKMARQYSEVTKNARSTENTRYPQEGAPRNRPHPPSDIEYVDAFQKIKLAFNLVAKLKGHIHEPNAADLIHNIFPPLVLLVQSCGGPNLARSVQSPLLTPQAIQLLADCLMSKESDLWSSLGPAWAIPKSAWPRDRLVPEYKPRFHSRRKSRMSARLSQPTGRKEVPMADSNNVRNVDETMNYDRALPPRNPTPNKMAVCLQDYVAHYSPELSMVLGEKLEVLDDSRKWWFVQNEQGQTGFAPSTFLRPIAVESKSSRRDIVSSEHGNYQNRYGRRSNGYETAQQQYLYHITPAIQREEPPQQMRHHTIASVDRPEDPSPELIRNPMTTTTIEGDEPTLLVRQPVPNAAGNRQNSPALERHEGYGNLYSDAPTRSPYQGQPYSRVIRSAVDEPQELRRPPDLAVTSEEQQNKPKAIAKYDFVARNHKELTIMARDILEIIDDSRMWWFVRNSSDQTGYVPSPLVQRLPLSASIDVDFDQPLPTPYNQSTTLVATQPSQAARYNQQEQELTIVQDVFSRDDVRYRPSFPPERDYTHPAPPAPPPPPSPPPPQVPSQPLHPNPSREVGRISSSADPTYAHVNRSSKRTSYHEVDETKNFVSEIQMRGSQQSERSSHSDHRSSIEFSPDLQPTEVARWLHSKGFSKGTVRTLGVLNGAQLLTLTADELVDACREEGIDVHRELTFVKANLKNRDDDYETPISNRNSGHVNHGFYYDEQGGFR